jgi:hypothetical protein
MPITVAMNQTPSAHPTGRNDNGSVSEMSATTGMAIDGKNWQLRIDLTCGRTRMADPATVGFERAWKVYLLINTDVHENDQRRATLDRFIRKQCDAGVTNTERLVVEALKYMKRLDQSEGSSLE